MRVHLTGEAALCRALSDLLTDPRVGYTVTSILPRVEVGLSLADGSLPRVSGDLGGAARPVMEIVQELAGDVIWAGSGGLSVAVPAGLAEPVLRGVLRGLMRYGKHGKRKWL